MQPEHKTTDCSGCDGRGFIDGSGEICPACHGSGDREMADDPQHKTDRKLVLAISNHDLALAIMQGAIGLKAPPGTVAEDALRAAAASEPEMVAGFYRAARNVAELIEREMNRVRH